jgi:hypothetical protein
LAKIVGKNATVTYDVVTEDKETEELLQSVLAIQVGALLNQDKGKLRDLSKTSIEPKTSQKSKAVQQSSGILKKENIENPELIALGGEWAYSVAITDDGTSKSVRIAKGKIKGEFYRNHSTGEMVLNPEDPMNPISLVNKINIKRLSEWEKLQVPVLTRLKAIEESRG